MKQQLLIFFVLIFLILLLVGLNAATYVQKEKVPDTEFAPNRTTYNSGSTGTQAFYALLSETGRDVIRWRASLETLRADAKNGPAVFVMIGPLRRDLTDQESTQLMEWVASGGTLVLIDREPVKELAVTTTQWQISVSPQVNPDLFVVDAADQIQMTAETPARKPVQPSYFSQDVNAVQASRFASAVKLERHGDVTAPTSGLFKPPTQTPSPTPVDFYSGGQLAPAPRSESDSGGSSSDDEDEEQVEKTVEELLEEVSFEAPIVHIGGPGQNLLVEAPFSQGRVVILSDPYIVSNNGISLVDNSRLAVNLVTSRPGQIAFDEYHHGYGANNNRFLQYFEGTPVIAIFLQCGLLIALVFFSQSRRFARPIAEPESSRLSKLEYVAAMAELQQRTRAYDLAIENIYADFRRRAAALVGLDNTTTTRKELAARIAERVGREAPEIEDLLYRCEDVIHGEPIKRSDALELVGQIRRLELALGMKRAKRGA